MTTNIRKIPSLMSLILENEEEIDFSPLTAAFGQQADDELEKIRKFAEKEVEKAQKGDTVNEEAVTLVLSIIACLPHLLHIASKIFAALDAKQKKNLTEIPTEKSRFQRWSEKLEKWSKDLHHKYIWVIKKALWPFFTALRTPEEKQEKICGYILTGIVVTLLLLSGKGAFTAAVEGNVGLAGIELFATVTKTDEVKDIIASKIKGELGAH